MQEKELMPTSCSNSRLDNSHSQQSSVRQNSHLISSTERKGVFRKVSPLTKQEKSLQSIGTGNSTSTPSLRETEEKQEIQEDRASKNDFEEMVEEYEPNHLKALFRRISQGRASFH